MAVKDANSKAFSKKKKAVRRLSVFNRLFLITNLTGITALVLSYLAMYISPEKFWFLQLFSLGYPYIILINLLFILYWALQWRSYFIFSFLAIAIGYKPITGYLQININKSIDNSKLDKSNNDFVKVMSYNVRVFDLYNWTSNKKTRNEIYALFYEEQPDILCLQEFFSDATRGFNSEDTLPKFLNAANKHIYYTTILRKTDKWGIATLSKYPIVNKGVISFGKKSNNICIFSDLKINDDTLRVFNCHLQSAHFSASDYKFIQDVQNNNETDEIEGSRRILTRLKDAFALRGRQADMIADAISTSPYKVLVCGDFNDPPCSYTYNRISENLSDAFKQSGNGFGRTYLGKFAPYRIDYILHSKEMRSYGFTRMPDELSDHYPIYTYLKIKRAES